MLLICVFVRDTFSKLSQTISGDYMKKIQTYRTDLAMEIREGLYGQTGSEIPGVEMTVEENDDLGVTVTLVKIINDTGAQAMGKPVGNYITLESDAMKENDPLTHGEIIKLLARKLGQLHRLPKDATILVIGLGNRYVTPDALGPQVCDKLLVTRHLGDATPTDLHGKLRAVCAIAPGVMGITGIETAEIVKGIAHRVRPNLIIAIDALAARRTSRINSTIQMCDTGINPGAGMGNKRTPINEKSMGIPVIGIGVPTVVDAATLVNDTMENMLSAMSEAATEGQPFFDMLKDMQDTDRYGLITELLESNMFVTPKDVDAVITRLAKIIADTLNIALHPGVTREDIGRYLE